MNLFERGMSLFLPQHKVRASADWIFDGERG